MTKLFSLLKMAAARQIWKVHSLPLVRFVGDFLQLIYLLHRLSAVGTLQQLQQKLSRCVNLSGFLFY